MCHIIVRSRYNHHITLEISIIIDINLLITSLNKLLNYNIHQLIFNFLLTKVFAIFISPRLILILIEFSFGKKIQSTLKFQKQNKSKIQLVITGLIQH